MKALTLHEPWAWLVLKGWKEVETRGWYTDYRGPLAIHAGRKRDADGRDLWDRNWMYLGHGAAEDFETLPFGCVIATCQLVACLPTMNVGIQAEKLKPMFEPKRGWGIEWTFGNYTPGRWAFILRDVVPVVPAIPVHGWQRLWNWSA